MFPLRMRNYIKTTTFLNGFFFELLSFYILNILDLKRPKTSFMYGNKVLKSHASLIKKWSFYLISLFVQRKWIKCTPTKIKVAIWIRIVMEKLEMANFFHICILVIFQIATVRCVHRGYNGNLNSNRSSRRISPVNGRLNFGVGN